MVSASERRLRAMIRKADARKKGALLANHFFGTVYSGNPLLTESQVDDMLRSFKSGDERHECATMLRAAYVLSYSVDEVQIKYLKVINVLTFLGGLFGRATDYLRIENLLNELCKKRSGDSDKRLQKRVVSTGRAHLYNITLKEVSGGGISISLEMSDDELLKALSK